MQLLPLTVGADLISLALTLCCVYEQAGLSQSDHYCPPQHILKSGLTSFLSGAVGGHF